MTRNLTMPISVWIIANSEENKPTCKKCPIHCYKPDMKEKMREAMRYAGPRMMWYHPIAAIKHLIREL